MVKSIKMPRHRIPGSLTIEKPHEFVETYFDRKRVRAAVYERDRLATGSRLRTPCIVVEYSAITLVPDDMFAELDGYENLIISLSKRSG